MIPRFPSSVSAAQSVRTRARLLLAAVAAVSALLQACVPDRPADVPATPSVDSSATVYDLRFPVPSFDHGRHLDTTLAVDLDDDGRIEHVVTSLGDDQYRPEEARCDLLEIYRFDTLSRAWSIVVRDTLEWGATIRLMDATGDRIPDLLVFTTSGGNDMVASQGLRIYSGDSGRVRPVFRSSRGDPELTTLKGVNGRAIVLHDELWPMFAPHSEAVVYASKLYAYEDGRYRNVGSEHSEYFRTLLAPRLAHYRQLRDSVMLHGGPGHDSIAGDDDYMTSDDPDAVDRDVELFNAAAMVIVNLQRGESRRSLLSFWDSERDFLSSALPGGYFDELETLYAGGTPQ